MPNAGLLPHFESRARVMRHYLWQLGGYVIGEDGNMVKKDESKSKKDALLQLVRLWNNFTRALQTNLVNK